MDKSIEHMKLRTCEMIIMDSSPLIYLAKANALGLLSNFMIRIVIPDEVFYECVGRWNNAVGNIPEDSMAIKSAIEGNPKLFRIVETSLGATLADARTRGTCRPIRNAGEMAAQEVFERRKEFTGGRHPVLVIFEDSDFPALFAAKDVHLLSTYGFLVVMEKLHIVESAANIINAIPMGQRPSNNAVDQSVKGGTEYISRIKRPSPGD